MRTIFRFSSVISSLVVWPNSKRFPGSTRMGVPSDVYVTRARGRGFCREISRSLVRPSKLRARAASNNPGFPILGVFRLNGQPKRDGSIIVRSCKASQSPVNPIRDAILAVNHASCPSLSSSDPRQWGESVLKTSRLPGALSPLDKIVVAFSLSLGPAITGRYDPTLPGTTVEEPTPRTTERSTTGSAAPDGLPS